MAERSGQGWGERQTLKWSEEDAAPLRPQEATPLLGPVFLFETSLRAQDIGVMDPVGVIKPVGPACLLQQLLVGEP